MVAVDLFRLARLTRGPKSTTTGLDQGAPAAVSSSEVFQAVLASGHAFSVSDARLPDCPLVWVNPAFERQTGYGAGDVIGRNCRFLQGAGTDPAAVARIRAAVGAGHAVTETLVNYRADGSTFWNRLSVSPVRDETGTLTHFVGVQSDVSDLVAADIARDQARDDARAGRARLRLLGQATAVMGNTLDPDTALTQLSSMVVPALADWCSILVTPDDRDQPVRMTLTHRDPALREVVEQVLATYRPDLSDDTPQSQVLRTGQPVLLANVDDTYIDTATTAPTPGGTVPGGGDGVALAEAWRRLGMRSCVVVPLTARDGRVGCLTLVQAQSGRRFDTEDLALAADLGRHAGVALDNARLYTAEHRIALGLQRSMLPELPAVPGLEFAARYLPGSDWAQVGGDWYDVLPLPDGATGLAIGDVMGHDIAAAAAMGQLRSVLRSYAWEGDRPAGVLDRLDRLVRGLGMAQLATCIYARIEPATDQDRPTGHLNPGDLNPGDRNPGDLDPGDAPVTVLRWSNAGHLPPLLRRADGQVQRLDAGASLVIGVNPGPTTPTRTEAVTTLTSGDLVLLYTDGLVEHRETDIDTGIDRIADILQGTDPDVALDDLADTLTAAASADRDDDLCLLLTRIM